MVHNRAPRRLIRQLGWWRMLGIQVFLGGIILSTLIHPLVYLMFGLTIVAGDQLALPGFAELPGLWTISLATLGLGYLSAMAVGFVAARRRGHGLGWSVLTMPLYWLLISFAGYRAIWQLWRDPFLWEKTQHGATTQIGSARSAPTGSRPRSQQRR